MIGKVLAVAAVLAIALNTYQNLKVEQSQTEMRELFASWKAKYDKVYSSAEEDEVRFANFVKSLEIITSHNSKRTSSFTMGLTKFSDLSHEEFSSIYANGLKVTEEEGIEDPYCPSAVNCPEFPAVNETYVNWTAAGAVTGIKNQGMCGSCWSFSTTGSLEGLYFLNNSVLLSFSEQQIIDCDTTCQACDGCWPYLALDYSAKAGNELESEYPYRAVQGKCRYVESLATKVNTGYKCVPQKSASSMQSASVGQPVSIAVDAGNNAWQYYAGGVVDGECTDSLDHAVLLVGYGDWQNQTAWFVKNSWGADWGANGYIYISQDPTPNQGFGICGILRCGTVPINETSAF